MSTPTRRQTPARADVSGVNPKGLKHPSTAAEDRSDPAELNPSKEAIANLKGELKGQAVLPADAGHDEARQRWNAMIDRQPAPFLRCPDAYDVSPAIAFAREYGLELSIWGGEHIISRTTRCVIAA